MKEATWGNLPTDRNSKSWNLSKAPLPVFCRFSIPAEIQVDNLLADIVSTKRGVTTIGSEGFEGTLEGSQHVFVGRTDLVVQDFLLHMRHCRKKGVRNHSLHSIVTKAFLCVSNLEWSQVLIQCNVVSPENSKRNNIWAFQPDPTPSNSLQIPFSFTHVLPILVFPHILKKVDLFFWLNKRFTHVRT